MFNLVSAVAALVVTQAADARPTTDPAVCGVADVPAQMERPWQDFEFSTREPGGPMWLAVRGCYRDAAAISRDYLAKGPPLSIREQAISQLHMARNLAFNGDEVAAAQAAASARRSDRRTDQEIPLDWNSYVQGVYAFLVKDRPLLDASLDRLRASSNQGDGFNARNLTALSTCFERSYYDAMVDTSCWPAVAQAARP